jgi:hypothetical protein
VKYLRFLIPLVLLSIAVPAFAVCGYCGGVDNNTCTWQQGLYQRCRYENYICYTLCVEEAAPQCDGPGFAESSFNGGYSIMSVTVEDAKATAIKNQAVLPPKKVKKTT